VAAVGALAVADALRSVTFASDLLLHPPKFPWKHNGFFTSYDHHS